MSMLLMAVTCMMCVSCKKEEEELEHRLGSYDIILRAGESWQISYYIDDEKQTNSKDNEKISWWSEDPNVAIVNNNGLVLAKHIGTTYVHANDLKCAVKVVAQYLKYYDPCIKWWWGKSEVKQYMSSYELASSPYDKDLVYYGKGTVMGYLYAFGDDGFLNGTMMVVSASVAEAEYLTGYLTERYLPAGSYDGSIFFTTMDGKTTIVLTVTTSDIAVYYTPRDSNTKSGGEEVNFEQIKAEMEQLLDVTSVVKK